MDKHLLAQQLRQRQYAHGYLPRHLIVAVSDEDMLDSYITCSCCGEKQMTPRQLEVAVAQAHDAYHFLMLCDEQARAASRGHIQLPTPGPNRPARRTHTGEGDVGVDQGRCGKEAELFRRIAGSLAHMMLKLALSTISDRTYTTPKSVLTPV